jgi:serine/threonine protein kinase
MSTTTPSEPPSKSSQPVAPDAAQFHVTSDSAVRITVYDAAWNICDEAEGKLQVSLPPGLYRVHLERAGVVDKKLVAHKGLAATVLRLNGPELRSPVPFTDAATSRDDHVAAAQRYSSEDTVRPLGDGPHTSRLLVLVRRIDHARSPGVPSEPVAIHDLAGRPLTRITTDNSGSDDGQSYLAFSCRVTPGIYRLRTPGSRRNVAIAIPAGRAAQVFIADTGDGDSGAVRINELRVALVPIGAGFNPRDPIWSAMEAMIAALRVPDRELSAVERAEHRVPDHALPAVARVWTDVAAQQDLCFGLLAAHLLLRRLLHIADGVIPARAEEHQRDREALAAVMAQLTSHPEIPDIAILERLHTTLSGTAATAIAIPDAPPMLSESLMLAMTRLPLAPDTISPDGPLAQAAQTRLHDSVWCTWSACTWDKRWIRPTVEALRAQGQRDPAAIACNLALPVVTVARTLQELDATLPAAAGPQTLREQLRMSGYELGERLGRGARSTVFQARRLDNQRDVALKIVPVPGGAAACARVLDALAQLAPTPDPAIIAASQLGALPDGTGIWLEMELCQGSVLDQLSTSDAPRPVDKACREVIRALAGLAQLHRRGLAHGAIHPRNLLVRQDDSIALADRGLTTSAMFATEAERAAAPPFPATAMDPTFPGTHRDVLATSMAWAVTPEQLAPVKPIGAPPDPRFLPAKQVQDGRPQLARDVWSMAATLYFLLTLELPRDEYAGQTPLDAARNNPTVPIADRQREVPRELARCLDRALSEDVRARPRDADALRSQLIHAESGPLIDEAALLHRFCFKPIKLDTPVLSYEPRGSSKCEQCTTCWLASKSGDIMRIALSTGQPRQSWFPGDREARTICHQCHQHDDSALNIGPFLLVGRDDGALDIIPDNHPGWTDHQPPQGREPPLGSFYIDSWWEHRDRFPEVAVTDGVPYLDVNPDTYSAGITAICVLPPRAPGALEILVATRQLRLYRIEARGGKLRLHAPEAMPNWIAWIIPSNNRDRHIACISLGGDFVRLRRDDLTPVHRPGHHPRLPVLPTAAMAFDDGVLIGTTTGLVLVDDKHPEGIAIPVTREPVLCLGSSTVTIDGDPGKPSGDKELVYVTMGLEDGKFRVVEADLIRALAGGGERSSPDEQLGDPDAGGHEGDTTAARRPRRYHNFPIEVGKPVLAVQAFQPTSSPSHHAYVMAALSNHLVRLYHVTTQKAVQDDVGKLWHAHVDRCFGTADAARLDARLANELAAADAPPPRESNAWKYMLVDVVLPHLRTQAPLRHDATADPIVGLACKLAEDADRIVLHRLTAAMGELTSLRADRSREVDSHAGTASEASEASDASELTGHRVSQLLVLSLVILRAVPHGDDSWLDFIESHLRELNALTHEVSGRHRTRLVAWIRFVRKYVRYGHTFDKDFGLTELVEHNRQSHKYLDALIYLTRLTRRGYDLRWESKVDGEVAALQVVDTRNAGAVLVVVTTDGGLALRDRASGEPLWIEDEHGQDLGDLLAVFGDAAQAQARACAAVRNGDLIRIVVGYTGENAPSSGLAVIELRRSGPRRMRLARPITKVKYVDPAHPGSAHAGPGKTDATARPDSWPRGGAAAGRSLPGLGVYAVRPLPGRADAFVVGMETIAQPVGLLRHKAGRWILELASDAPSERSDGAPEPGSRHSLAPGKMPTRALAVAATNEPRHYLVVAGSDDGIVRAISFRWGARATTWELTRWDRLTDAISSVALGASKRSAATRGSDESVSVFSCYVGTVTGDVFALSILRRDRGVGTAVSPFGYYDAQPLWREKHDSPVLAMEMWHTPPDSPAGLLKVPAGHALYGPNEVLVTTTEKGRLCIYNHVPQEGHFSAASNYYFRGMRFERLALPDRTRALAVIGGSGEFVAAGPQGKLYLGRVAWPRESNDRRRDETCAEERKRDVSEPAGDPPREMWARLHYLFAKNRHGEYFYDTPTIDANADYKQKLELCKLIRVRDGAVHGYALRKQLLFDRPWLDPNLDMRGEAHRYLRRLDPEKPTDADQIKIVLRSLCRTFLLRNPDQLRSDIIAPHPPRPDLPAEAPDRDATTAEDAPDNIAVACEIVADYIARDLAYATDATARMRISAIKELLHVPALLHMAERPGDPYGPRIKEALATAVGTCLRDDNRLVRIETLRALLLMLRNVCTMAEAPGPSAERERLIAVLFPRGLGSLEWLLELIVDGLQRFPSFTQRTALVSAAWFHISVLLPLFRLFPDRTLTLCDYLMRAGLDVEVLALCYRSLRRPGTAKARSRIEHFFLLKNHDVRDEFIKSYRQRSPEAPEFPADLGLGSPGAGQPSGGAWHEIDDTVMAHRLARLLDQLAHMWSVQDDEIKHIQPLPRPASTASDAPLAALEHVVAELSSIAAGLSAQDSDKFAELAALGSIASLSLGAVAAAPLTSRIRTIVNGIVGEWREIFASRETLVPGKRIGNYEILKRLSAREDGWLFELSEQRVIKIVSRLDNPDVVERFIRGARLHEKLYEKAGRDGPIVQIKEIIVNRRWVAYVMPKYQADLGRCLDKETLPRDTALAWTRKAAEDIGGALRLVHHEGKGFSHGDVQPTNILVRAQSENPSHDHDPGFALGDFDHMSSRDDGGERLVPPLRIVPECLSRKYEGDDVFVQRQWDDVAGLSLVLYRMLTGRTIDRSTKNLHEQVAELKKLHREIPGQDSAKHVVRTVQNMLDIKRPAVPIDAFLASAFPDSTAPALR